MLPLLKFIQNGRIHIQQDVVTHLLKEFKLTEEEFIAFQKTMQEEM